MDEDCSYGAMENTTSGTGTTTSGRDMGPTAIQTEINIGENTKTGKRKEKVSMNGRMETYIQGTGKMI